MGKRSREHAEIGPDAVKPKDKAASLLQAKKSTVDPSLALLFASSAGPVTVPPKSRYDGPPPPTKKTIAVELTESESENDEAEEVEKLSSVDRDLEEESALGLLQEEDCEDQPSNRPKAIFNAIEGTSYTQPRKKKLQNDEDDLEGQYMLKIAKEEEKEELKRQTERSLKRLRMMSQQDLDMSEDEEYLDSESDQDGTSDKEPSEANWLSTDVPRHETLGSLDKGDGEIEKASRTVFLANVSTLAITDKKAKKILLDHMDSFLDSLAAPPDGKTKNKVESIRFRSTAYTGGGLPKKASFATKSVMDATTKSTNAYLVYSTAFAAREAVKRLNATIVLDRHLRVDGVAHPAKIDHRRCVFVGNLGFVDDESMLEQGGEGERKRSKIPSDIEEGLWRQFGKAGKVESVRVVRDEKTRVGKGFAYVQFEDANAVEAALLFHEKKYPPMLPRVLRVTRAKAMKKTERAEKSLKSTHPLVKEFGNPNRERIYNPKMTSQQQSFQGRAAKLLGRAGAAQFKKIETAQAGDKLFKAPESFVFEGYRASSMFGKPKDLKMGGKGGKRRGKPRTRSTKRASEWKKKGAKKAA